MKQVVLLWWSACASVVVVGSILQYADGFSIPNGNGAQRGRRHVIISQLQSEKASSESTKDGGRICEERRSLFRRALAVPLVLKVMSIEPEPSKAALGTLPEFADTNAILQGLTITVADQSQQDAMIKFLVDGFEFTVTRKRIQGPIEDTVCMV
jgi:hypothetical protein